jgi:hypothetical protein
VPLTVDTSPYGDAGDVSIKRTSSSNALLKSRPQDSMLEAEKMPASTPNAAPHLTPRLSISPPRAGFRARSKTISPSLSSHDLRNQGTGGERTVTSS